MAVACSPDRHLSIRELLALFHPDAEEAHSSDGFLSVFVAEFTPPPRPEDVGPVWVVATEDFRDHRGEKIDEIDAAVQLFRSVLGRRNQAT
jgi:hypothetical protein